MTHESDTHRLVLRQTRSEDYDDIAEIMERVYPGALEGAWTREQFESQIRRFPDGQLCIEDNGKVVGAAISLIVKYSRWGHDHCYWDIVGDGYLTTHDPKGDILYGVDVFVNPDYRDLRLGRRLYDARKELCENLNLRGIVVVGGIPGFSSPENWPISSCRPGFVRNRASRYPNTRVLRKALGGNVVFRAAD